MEPNTLSTPGPPNETGPRHLNWLLILALLIGPAVVAFLGASTHLDWLAVASPLIGGLVGGLYCGIRVARRYGKSAFGKILIGLILSAVVGCVIIGIGLVGCALGDFKMGG
jgi:hypothetical protein